MGAILKIAAVFAALVVGVFLLIAEGLTDVQHPDPADVDGHFRSVLREFGDPTPMLRLEAAGSVTRQRRKNPQVVPTSPVDFVIVAWKDAETGLVETRMPIWLLGMWRPARNYLLRDTNFDPDAWGLTVSDLKAHGPGLVIDHYSPRGGRILVWTE